MEYLKMLLDFSGYEDRPGRWKEPTARDMAAICVASFAFFMLLFWGC